MDLSIMSLDRSCANGERDPLFSNLGQIVAQKTLLLLAEAGILEEELKQTDPLNGDSTE
jgi:hypothetical protein